MDSVNENVIENIQGNGKATLTIAPRCRLKKRVLLLKESHPDEVEILSQNKDGSICAKIPFSWIKINPSKNLSEEQKNELRERITRLRSGGTK